MLATINVPSESAAEFYATPELRHKPNTAGLSSQSSFNSDGGIRQSSQKRLFTRRRSSQVEYLKDGRKVLDGAVIENATAPQLWEKLLLRSLVHKIEDEIASPVPAEKITKQPLSTLVESAAEYTNSTLSLVSKELLDQELPNNNQCASLDTNSTKKRSHSFDCPRKLNHEAEISAQMV